MYMYMCVCVSAAFRKLLSLWDLPACVYGLACVSEIKSLLKIVA